MHRDSSRSGAGRSERARTVFDDVTTRATRGMTDGCTDGWTGLDGTRLDGTRRDSESELESESDEGTESSECVKRCDAND